MVVTLVWLEVVDQSMTSPAPIEVPVQRGGFVWTSFGTIH